MPTIRFNNGQNTSDDLKRLAAGELRQSVGAEYRIGNRGDLFKAPGRGDFADTGSSAKVDGLALLQFDTKASDRLVALSNGTLYAAIPGAGAAFSSIKTGLSASATRLGYAHYNDKHHLVNGYDRMQVLDNAQSVRDAGMLAPSTQPVGTASTAAGTVTRAESTALANDGFSNFANSVDGDLTTFANAPLSAVGSATATWEWGTLGYNSGDQVYISWALAGQSINGPGYPDTSSAGGGSGESDSGYSVNILIEFSEDDGATFTTVLNQNRTSFTSGVQTLLVVRSSTDNNLVHVRVTLTYARGTNQASLQVHDVKIQDNTDAAASTTSDVGIVYARTEYDEATGIESPPSPISAVFTGMFNQVKLTGPTASVNTNTTHYRYYRTPDGGVAPQDLGFVGATQVGSSKVFIDDFSVYGAADQPGPPLEMVAVEADGATLYFDANQPPPLLDDIEHFDGSLVGIHGRALYYSIAGRPESWPHINVITAFPMKEHDKLVGLEVLGKSLVMGAENVMIVLDGLPKLESGIFSGGEPRKIEGAPGLVNQYAITAYADDDDSGGEPRVAWVSQFGVHETNGFRHRRLTSDIDWKNEVSLADLANAVLHWNAETQQLILSYAPDRYALIHMADEHRKDGGRPKVTWGHYGRLNDMASGFVDSAYYVYSAHDQNGWVYTERKGLSDSSLTYDSSGTVPFVVESGRLYDDDYVFVTGVNLSHSSAPGESIAVTWTSGRDNPRQEQARTKSVVLTDSGGTQFSVIQAGEWHQIKLEHYGFSEFSVQDVRLKTQKMAEAGAIY